MTTNLGDKQMSNDYSRPPRAPFPTSLAERIARKAAIMAGRLEDQAIRTMVREARRGLDRGMTEAQIGRELELP